MDRQLLTGQWAMLREPLKKRFDRLTDGDLERVAGKYDELLALLRERYGTSQEQVESELTDFMTGFDPARIHPLE